MTGRNLNVHQLNGETGLVMFTKTQHGVGEGVIKLMHM